MPKNILLEELKLLHACHQTSRLKVKMAIEGISNENPMCLSYDECPVQAWMDRRKNIIDRLFGYDILSSLQIHLDTWYEDGHRICKLINQTDKKGLLLKVFENKEVFRQQNKDKALAFYSSMEETAKEMEKIYSRIIKRTQATQQDFFLKAV